MAQPPSTPNFDKAKFTDAPIRAAFVIFWDLLFAYFERITSALRGDLTVSENLAGGWVDLSIEPDQSFPIRGIANPITSGRVPYGVLVAAVRDPVDPDKIVIPPAGSVTVQWTLEQPGGLIIQGITGLVSETRYTVRLLVLAR